MPTKITRDSIESYLNCEFKAHLKLAGHQGTPPDYELLLAEARDRVRRQATDKIVAANPAGQVERDVALTPAVLKRGAAFLLNATLEDDTLCLVFDGLKRVPGPSKLGDFHYLPVLFCEGCRVRKAHRTLLDVYGLLLARLQGRAPATGVVWHGKDCKASRVRLGPDPRKAERLLEDLRRMQGGEAAPRLLLNDHCAACEFRQRCHAQAAQEDNLSLLRGMKAKEVKAYARKGILTVTQLAHTFRPRRKGRRARHKDRHSFPLQALAIRDRKAYVLGSPSLPDAPVRVYLDLEGKPEEGFVYLLGALVEAGGSVARHSFWADTPEQEALLFKQFLGLLRPFEDFRVFCYGAYELAFLRRMGKAAGRKRLAAKVLKNTVNVLSALYAHVHFPVHSNGLKDVGRHLGCSWADPDASGLQSLVWRARWEQSPAEGLKRKLIDYNLEDCAALKAVTEFLFAVAANAAAAGQPAGALPGGVAVPDVQSADGLPFPPRWGPARFFHPDFAHITKCSYFNYQRQRVYVRAGRVTKRKRAGSGKHTNRKLRVSRRLVIAGRACPHCKSKEVVPIRRSSREVKDPRSKRAFDLVVTPAGVRRRVIECRTTPYRCKRCGKAFLPEAYERLDKHFHGLKSWAMYQHVAQNMGLARVKAMLREFFGLKVHFVELQMFKSLLARRYRPAYRQLLGRLLAGKVLHVDETEVLLKTGKAYVWVFASAEDVVYLYRPTREGAFLQDLLKGFSGVLVSDFYAAYDSLPCPQQKCLIHLIRDMNQDLLNNPFDEELQSVTGPFGALLREIVATIDGHGLKRRHLKQHERGVARFFEMLEGRSFRSEAAAALRERLLKNRDKLFTFLRHDGVPWNNTDAENAIKRFARYREMTEGTMKERGLSDYLVLLSLCHTCHYRGLSFLKFLLSRQRDLAAFAARGRARLPRPVIELYPKGFVPPHLAGLREKRDQEPGVQAEQGGDEGG
jgi:predicted RecB family nuclease